MVELSVIFIAVCIVLIGVCLGIIAFFMASLSFIQAAVVGLAGMAGLALYNVVSARIRDQGDVGGQIADMSRASADIARQVAELSRRVAAVEQSKASAGRDAVGPVMAEISELGSLLKQLAETVAAHDAKLGGVPAPTPDAALSMPVVMPANDRAAPAAPVAAAAAAGEDDDEASTGALAGKSSDEIVSIIRAAVDANRIDLYLQPIVTLPQRKVRYYEALTRLRTEHGTLIMPEEFIPHAEAHGLMPKIDNLVLFRAVQLVRRLLVKNRDVGLFCNIAVSTLSDPDIFPEVSQFLEGNRAIAPSLVLELRQSAWRRMGVIESTNLSSLAACGYRFSMDHVADLRFEPRDLIERGIRFIKVPGSLLLNWGNSPPTDIHAADLSDLLGRFGISLIADRVEGETTVVDLLDYDVRFGQGTVFSHPRPVRAEALRGPGEKPESPTAAEAFNGAMTPERALAGSTAA